MLSYYAPIVRTIGKNNIDIIFVKQRLIDQKILQDSGLSDFDYYYDLSKALQYKVIVTDVAWINMLLTKFNEFGLNFDPEQNKIISLIHSLDVDLDDAVDVSSCAIVANKKQLNKNRYIFNSDQNTFDTYKKTNKICEIACTGPYHIAPALKMRSIPKNELRLQLSEKIGREIPSDKPLIAVLEDELSDWRKILIGLERLSEYATIIYKPLFAKHVKKFNKNIILYPDSRLAPNLLRFSADFIFAGYRSGTFVSSCMLSLPVLPYYTEFVQSKWHKDSEMLHYTKFIPKNVDSSSDRSINILTYRFNNSGHLFNILDTTSIKNAILGQDYINWYNSSISEIQKEAFNDYMIEGSAEKTAIYIMRFAENGTLGKDCQAIYVKK